jgi:hypothetical protein
MDVARRNRAERMAAKLAALCPQYSPAQLGKSVEMLWHESDWDNLGAACGFAKPSEETRQLTVALLRENGDA